MNEPHYPFEASPNRFHYEFESVSEAKTVRKAVVFQATRLADVFNLVLLDLLESGEESDSTITDNQDLRLVMATVMRIVEFFSYHFPSHRVYFTGNDERKTRLYRIVIGREISQLRHKFNVLGRIGTRFEYFEVNRPYTAFIVSTKTKLDDENP